MDTAQKDTAANRAQSGGPDEAPVAVLAQGRIRSLNASMAKSLNTPADRCVGRMFADLLPTSQRATVDLLLRAATESRSPAMRVLEFPGSRDTTIAGLVEAVPVEGPAGKPAGEQGRVRVREVQTPNDLDSLLIPFRMAAKLAGLSLFLYLQDKIEWLGGAAPPIELARTAPVPIKEIAERVHPQDRAQLMRIADRGDAPLTLRFHTDQGGWQTLVSQTRRIRLGFAGPERVVLFVRNDSGRQADKKELLDALGTERIHARHVTEFSSALIAATTEKELQQVLLTRTAPTFGGTGCVLALAEDGRLRVSSDAGTDPRLTKSLDGMSLQEANPLPYAIRTGQPQFISTRQELVRRWPEVGGLLPLSSDRALSVVPFGSADGPAMGAVGVTYSGAHEPSPEQQAQIVTLGDLVGLAVSRVRSQQARMELAAIVQQTMLPTLPTHLPGLEIAARYHPARDGLDVGGDWYDAFAAPDATAVLEIGDAQGHDVDAAAFMGQVRASLRAFASHEPEPDTVLARTNQLFVAMAAAKFASCTMLRFHPRNGRVDGASAGHVPLVWARADGSHGTRELPGGPVLGVLAGADYDHDSFSLDKDTALILVTDGVVEGPGTPLDTGLERAGALAAQALREGLDTQQTADRVLGAAAAVGHLDDAAVLVVRRR
jgi:serine phosphatase RsbU (regulator of sigma subunit)